MPFRTGFFCSSMIDSIVAACLTGADDGWHQNTAFLDALRTSGTSVAAAVLAGACALLLQWGIREGNDLAMSTYQIRAYLIRGCLRRSDMEYPNNLWGCGVMQLMQTFHLMREL